MENQTLAEEEKQRTKHRLTLINSSRLTTRQHIEALVLAGSPIVLGLLLFVVNPTYLGRLFTFACESRVTGSDLCTQPLDFIMGCMIFPLVSIGYFGIRGAMTLLRGPRRTLAVLMIYMLFVFPALYIVLFGPATLVILETSSIGQ